MATQDEARQAILDAIVKVAPDIHGGQSAAGDQLKALADAWVALRQREGGRTIGTL
jgi:hypothetical protein